MDTTQAADDLASLSEHFKEDQVLSSCCLLPAMFGVKFCPHCDARLHVALFISMKRGKNSELAKYCIFKRVEERLDSCADSQKYRLKRGQTREGFMDKCREKNTQDLEDWEDHVKEKLVGDGGPTNLVEELDEIIRRVKFYVARDMMGYLTCLYNSHSSRELEISSLQAPSKRSREDSSGSPGPRKLKLKFERFKSTDIEESDDHEVQDPTTKTQINLNIKVPRTEEMACPRCLEPNLENPAREHAVDCESMDDQTLMEPSHLRFRSASFAQSNIPLAQLGSRMQDFTETLQGIREKIDRICRSAETIQALPISTWGWVDCILSDEILARVINTEETFDELINYFKLMEEGV